VHCAFLTSLNFFRAKRSLLKAFYNELRIAPEEGAVIITESSFGQPANREKLTQIMFETFSVAGLMILPASVLALRSFGLPTGLSIHSGETATEIVPVVDNAPLREFAGDYPVTGSLVSGYLFKTMKEFNGGPSNSAVQSIIKDIKTRHCFASLDPSSQSPVKAQFELPDGSFANVDDASWMCVEPIFYPELISIHARPLVLTIVDIVKKCPKRVQQLLLENIVLSGRNLLFPGFAQRLEKDLKELIGDANVKVVVKQHKADSGAGFEVWAGASIEGTRADFANVCLVKEQYDEFGPAAIHSIGVTV